MTGRGRILYIEDERTWQDLVEKILAQDGFQVDVASSFDVAIRKLKEALYHLAIIDIRLLDYEASDVSGMHILDTIDELGFGDGIEKMMMTAYATTERIRKAFKRYNVADFITKDALELSEFRKVVREIFERRVQANFGLEINPTGGLSFENMAAAIPVESLQLPGSSNLVTRVRDELVDLFQRLFYSAQAIVIHPIIPGQRAPRLVKVEPAYEGERGESVIVKFGGYCEIEAEYREFKATQPRLINGRPVTIHNLRRTPLLGGIVYDQASSEYHLARLLKDFETLLQEREQILTTLSEVERTAQLGQLALDIAHEILQPVHGILLLAEQSLKKADQSVREQNLAAIMSEAKPVFDT